MKYSCAIVISHFESPSFLDACIRQIRKHANSSVHQKIIVAEQSSIDTYYEILKKYAGDKDIRIVKMQPYYSGYGIDFIMRNVEIETDYICQIHCDAFGISDKWLLLPITLIEEYNFSFVGQLHFWSRPTDTIYPPTPFFSMSPTFNVAKTETYKELSLQAGFTRFHNRPQSGLTFENNDWADWAKEDYNARGSDDDVVAFHWNGKYKTDNMLGLAISGYIEPSYGRIIDDVVFHFGSCREAKGVMDKMPELYQCYTKRINENYDDVLISEMVAMAKANKPPHEPILIRNHWDGVNKISSPPTEQLNKRIEELKNVE